MNKKSYVKWQIKSLLPIYIIIIIVVAFSFLLSILSTDLVPTVYEIENGEMYVVYFSAYPPLYGIAIPSILAALALPISIFSYQTNHVKSDFFYQIPLREKELRKIKLVLNLSILEAIITIVYWIGVILIALKQPLMNIEGGDYFIDNPYYYNYVFFIPYYFYLVLSVAIVFFTSSYFASLGTRVIDTILYLIFGQGFLAFFFTSLVAVLLSISHDNDALSDIVTSFLSFSWLEPCIFTNSFCQWLMNNSVNNMTNTVIRIISNIGFLLVGIASFLAVWKKKDPSGEYAGKIKTNNIYTSLYVHLFCLMTGLFSALIVGAGVIYVIGWIFFISWCVQYYFLTVAINGGFHFKKRNWYIMIGVASFVLLVSIALTINSIVY